MALKGLDIFKLTPKTNCKDCGNPTCMAFAMKVAQGGVALEKCPHLSEDALAQLGDATAPPMRKITLGADGKSGPDGAGGADGKGGAGGAGGADGAGGAGGEGGADGESRVGGADGEGGAGGAGGAGGKSCVYTLGGETVLFRHDKTFVSKNLFAVSVCADCFDEALPEIKKIDYDRLGERMYVELLNVVYSGGKDAYAELVKKAAGSGRGLILECGDPEAARAALEICAAAKPLLNGANPANYQAMNALASEFGVVLGVSGANLDELYDTTTALEALGNKNLVLDVGCACNSGADGATALADGAAACADGATACADGATAFADGATALADRATALADGAAAIKDAFAGAVQIRRAALRNNNRTFGYPSLVNVGKLAPGNEYLQTALASVFILKYGSIIVMEKMAYAQALPLFGLRQNIFTDPQKPMKVNPGIYPLNGADENSICVTTVDFALTYFVVSGELERSGVPMNLLISDAGGYSVLTAWAAGKLSASSIAKFFKEFDIESRIKSRTLVIPGKVAVLKGEIEENLPGWKVIVAPNEAVEAVKYFRELKF